MIFVLFHTLQFLFLPLALLLAYGAHVFARLAQRARLQAQSVKAGSWLSSRKAAVGLR